MKKRFRHVFVFTVMRPFFRLYAYCKFGFKAKRFKKDRGVKGPYLIISNHAMAFDPFFVSLSFKETIFYIASDMIFSIPFVSPIIRYLVQPIPKTKYRSDTATVKDTIRIIKSGGSVGLFPEGNATFHGELMDVPFAVAKLIRLLKVPVLFYQLRGGYQTKPRWARSVRKGKIVGSVASMWSVEDYRDLSVDQIYQEVLKRLDIKNFAYQLEHRDTYPSKESAMDIESAYFVCPDCHSMHSIVSQGQEIYCRECNFKVVYTEHGLMKSLSKTKFFQTTYEWYLFQERFLKSYLDNKAENDLIFEDSGEKVLKVIRARKKTKVGDSVWLKLYKNRIEFGFQDRVESWDLKSVQSAVQQKNKLIFYHRQKEITYYCLNHPKRNALKYVIAIEYLNTKEDN